MLIQLTVLRTSGQSGLQSVLMIMCPTMCCTLAACSLDMERFWAPDLLRDQEDDLRVPHPVFHRSRHYGGMLPGLRPDRDCLRVRSVASKSIIYNFTYSHGKNSSPLASNVSPLMISFGPAECSVAIDELHLRWDDLLQHRRV